MKEKSVGPTKIQIEISDVCNLRCWYCDIHHVEQHVGCMNFKTYENILTQAPPQITQVFPQFWGEPTMNPEFEKILEYTKSLEKLVSFYTNGTLLHKHNLSKVLLNTNKINISIQSMTPEHFILTSGVDLFNQVSSNVQMLWQTNENLGSPCIINIRATNLDFTQKQMSSFKSFWKPYCHNIIFKPLRSLKTGINPFPPHPNYNCNMLTDHIIIKCDGSLVLCCTDHFGTVKIGNVLESSIDELLQSDIYEKLKKSIGTMPICLNCWYRYKEIPNNAHKAVINKYYKTYEE